LPTSNKGIDLGTVTIAPDSKEIVEIPVTTGLNGSSISLTVHALVGAKPGPVLCLMNTLHGGEWYAMEPLRRLRDDLDTSQMAGAVVIVPVANPAAFALDIRNVPDQVDSPDMNRIFPGPLTSTGDQIVAAITKNVLSISDALIDFHMGPKGSAFTDALTASDLPGDLSERCLNLALAFGSPIVRHAPMIGGFPGPKSSKPFAATEFGIPGFGGEVGGAGFGPELDAEWHQRTYDGVLGVMQHLGIIEEADVKPPDRQLVYKNAHRINPSVGGILKPAISGRDMGCEVSKGTVLGHVISPYTGEVLEELTAPADGLVYYVAREHPVYPGGWAFGLSEIDDEARWIDNTGVSE
jgi:predicted deacylase